MRMANASVKRQRYERKKERKKERRVYLRGGDLHKEWYR